MTKKITTKSTKSPTPATKTTKPAAKKVRADATRVAPSTSSSASVATLEAPPLAPVTTDKPTTHSTTITARIDIGFGNALYLRGEGAGLTWERGLPMNCLSSDEWQIALGGSSRPIVFKFLLNDITWSAGPDYTVNPGETVTIRPEF